MLSLHEEIKDFDQEIVIYINSALAHLQQLGVGKDGFRISGDAELWEQFVDDVRMDFVKEFIYLKVRLIFDPPTTSFLNKAFEDQLREIEWRLRTQKEVRFE